MPAQGRAAGRERAEDRPLSPWASLIGLSSAATFGMMTVFARMAYTGGSEPFSVSLVRAFVGFAAVAAFVPVFRLSLTVPRRVLPALLLITVTRFAASLGVLVAIVFIPVGLAILFLYTYPLLVAAGTSAMTRKPLGTRRWIAFAVAFAGLALTIAPNVDVLDWRGIALSVFAALNLSAMLIVSNRAVRETNFMAISFFSNLGAIPLYIAALVIAGGFIPPGTTSGWVGLVGLCLCYAIAVVAQFASVHYVGAVRTAMLQNLEPLVAITGAALLLGETLEPLQYAGGALVIGALIASARAAAPR